MDKLLSIIIPSYNMEKYLPKCLGSLIVDDAALLSRLDVIVVNDGSNDRTSEIAHDFMRRYPGVCRVIDKGNGNYGSCVNAALPVAKGRFVKILDADDWLETASLNVFVDSLSRVGDGVDVVITDYQLVDGDGNVLDSYEFDLPIEMVVPVSDVLDKLASIQMHAYTYRTERLRGIDYKQCEGVSYSDTEWVTVPLIATQGMYYQKISLYRYLQGRDGQTMAPAIFKQNVWMLAKVTLHICSQIESLHDRGIGVNRDALLEQIVHMLVKIYRDAILQVSTFAGLDLVSYDRELLLCAPLVHQRIGSEYYSKRMRYRFIAAWRGKSLVRYLVLPLCRAYTKILTGV